MAYKPCVPHYISVLIFFLLSLYTVQWELDPHELPKAQTSACWWGLVRFLEYVLWRIKKSLERALIQGFKILSLFSLLFPPSLVFFPKEPPRTDWMKGNGFWCAMTCNYITFSPLFLFSISSSKWEWAGTVQYIVGERRVMSLPYFLFESKDKWIETVQWGKMWKLVSGLWVDFDSKITIHGECGQC